MISSDTALAPDQFQHLEALLSSPSHTKAAKKAGISRSTLYRMLSDRALQEAYRGARMQALQHAISRLQLLSDQAVSELESILTDKKLSAYIRLRAVELVLVHSLQGSTLDELILRVEDLEAYHHAQTD